MWFIAFSVYFLNDLKPRDNGDLVLSRVATEHDQYKFLVHETYSITYRMAR
jgi:hypothetical protein